MAAFTVAIFLLFPLSFQCAAGSQTAAKTVYAKNSGSAKSNSAVMKKSANTFETPDFAFPETVAENASVAYGNALKSGNWTSLLKAAMQLCVVENSRHAEASDSCVRIFERVADIAPAPYNALALFMKAKVLSDCYNGNRWQFDQRNLPADPVPSDPNLWDKKMFASAVLTAVEKGMALAEPFANLPISDFSALLKNSESAAKYGFSLSDFLGRLAFDYLGPFASRPSGNRIPFTVVGNRFDTSSDCSPAWRFLSSLAGREVAALSRDTSAPKVSVVLGDASSFLSDAFGYDSHRSSQSALARFWLKYADFFKGTPAEQPLLCKYIGEIPDYFGDAGFNIQAFVARCDESLALFASAPYAPNLRNWLITLKSPACRIELPNQVLPDREVKAGIVASNITDLWLQVVKLPGSASRENYTVGEVLTSGEVVNTVKIDFGRDTPFHIDTALNIGSFPAGLYGVVLTKSKSPSASDRKSRLDAVVMNVSELGVLTERCIERNNFIYVVDGKCGAPVQNAKVECYTRLPYNSKTRSRDLKLVSTVFTDSTGCVALGKEGADITELRLASDGSRLIARPYLRQLSEYSDSLVCAAVFPDRSIARPGEKVGFEALFYYKHNHILQLIKNKEVCVRLRNASGVVVDSLRLKTNSEGNVASSFTLPESGMLGVWGIEASMDRPEVQILGACTLRVEQYKTPSFAVVAEAEASPDVAADAVRLPEWVSVKGSAIAYSGVPVADAKVSVTVTYRPARFFYGGVGGASFSADTVTDSNGCFTLRLSTSELKNTPFATGVYSVDVNVASSSGESQSGSCLFALGNTMSVCPDIPDRLEVEGESLKLKVPVRDMMNLPKAERVRYEVFNVSSNDSSNESVPVLNGVFMSPSLTLPSSSLPSGRYCFRFRLADEDGADSRDDNPEVASEVTLWRASDLVPPIDSPLWVPVDRITARPGDDTVEVKFGATSVGQRVLCVVADSKSVISRDWYSPEGKMLTVTVPAPRDDSRMFVKFYTIRDLKPEKVTVTVLPASEAEPLKCETVSFRNRLVADAKERFTFRFTNGGKPNASVSALAVMTDKALNALVPFRWYFSPRADLSWSPAAEGSWYYIGSSSLFMPVDSQKRFTRFEFSSPSWIYSFTGFNMVRDSDMVFCSVQPTSFNGMIMQEKKMSRGYASADSVYEEAEYESDDAAEEPALASGASADAGGGEGVDVSDVKLRQSECPVAFFRPNLHADSEGKVDVEFEVPDFNTTWQFALLGYDGSLATADMVLDAMSAKEVMVKINSPRFVRTADRIVLTATAYNNSDAPLSLGGKIEIADVVSGKVLASKSFKGEKCDPSASRLLTLDFKVPSDVSILAVRAYASGNGHSDGEQAPLQVLPSSSPVLESLPFYIAPSQSDFSVVLPKFPKDASVTLAYCNNPLWYAVTALPALGSDSGASILSVLGAFYGSCIGRGLVGKYPELRQGLQDMLSLDAKGESDMLVSRLQNNQELKIVGIENTPWVNDAESETLRMRSLSSLLNSEEADAKVAALIGKLKELHRADGGFAWCPKGESSVWATSKVLLYNAMLLNFGYLPADNDYRSLLTAALKFVETEWLESLGKRTPTDSETEGLMNFLYVRSAYRNSGLMPAESKEFKRYADKCLALVAANWRNYDVYDKSSAATLLYREGKKDEARLILESLAQLAIRSSEKGMWFDNVSGGSFSPWNKLVTTAQALEAYSEIEPASPDIDAIRQWLLLQRQAEDWGRLGYGAELVQALLSCGVDWSEPDSSVEIKLGNRTIASGKDIPAYGEVTLNLPAEKSAGSKLQIRRDSASPAWGGVICQFVKPILEATAASNSEVSLRKDVYLMREVNGELTALPINAENCPAVGDLVRVLLTVACNRDMEYVVVGDERASCLEPVDALSGRDIIDGVWLYREVRNDVSNLYIPFLRKGSFQISYDCRLAQEGDFTAGIATLQSQYAPSLSAHSAGKIIAVSRQ